MDFFPTVHFLALDAHNAVPTHRIIDPAGVAPDYTTCRDPCELYALRSFGYQVQDSQTINIDVYARLVCHRSVITQANVDSAGLMARQGVCHIDSVRAREYNAFMRTRTFCCAVSLAYHFTSNCLHDSLRTCLWRLQDAVGWQLPAGAVLHTRMPASVLLRGVLMSYAESVPTQCLTSTAWADQDHVLVQCHVLPPVWQDAHPQPVLDS